MSTFNAIQGFPSDSEIHKLNIALQTNSRTEAHKRDTEVGNFQQHIPHKKH